LVRVTAGDSRIVDLTQFRWHIEVYFIHGRHVDDETKGRKGTTAPDEELVSLRQILE